MKTSRTYPPALCLILGLMLVVPLAAQEEQPSAEEAAMMKAMTPGSQHAFLAEQVGTWKTTMTMWTDPSAPPMKSEGTMERTLLLGGRVLKETFKLDFMGMPFEGVGHTGYDNVTGKYWGTWFDNMSTGVITLEGTMDEATGKGTLKGEVSEPMAGKKIPMRIEIHREEGKEINEFYMPGPGGEMVKSMEIVYERQ